MTPTSGSCPGASFTVTITVSPKPNVIAQTQTICSAGTFTVSPSNGSGNIVPTGTSYSWSAPSVSGITGTVSGSNLSTISGTLTNTTNEAINVVYNVTPTSGSCTGSSFTVTVIVKPVPSIANNNQSVCSNANYLGNWSIPDIVPLNTLYTWSVTNNTQVIGETNNSTLQTFGQTLTNLTLLNQSVSYTITPTTNGCIGLPFTLNLEVKPAPLANAGADFSKTCIQNASGAMIGASAIPGYTYAWTTIIGLSASNISNPIANPLSTTIYTLTVTDPLSSCSSKDSVIVTVNNFLPIANAGADGTITCIQNTNGATIGSAAISGIIYSWAPISGIFISNSSSTIALPNQTTTYVQTATNTSSGCTATDQVIVTVNNSLPSVNAGPNTAICEGAIVSLSGTAPSTINTQWSPSFLVSNPSSLISTATIQGTTTFTLTATGSNGCTSSDYVTISVNPIPESGLNNHYEICTNNNLQLNVSPNLTCQWSGLLNSISNTINQSVDFSGTIILEISDNNNNCSSTEEITINLLPIPYPIITGAGQLCQNSYWEKYSVPSTSNFLDWSVVNGEFQSDSSSNEVYIHWTSINPTNQINGQVIITETIASTGCQNSYLKNVILDTTVSPAPATVLALSSNVLYTTEDYSFMNWGYESIVTHIPVSVGVYSQYCNYNNIDLSSYYYWVEIGNGNGCITKSYFNYPTFTANIDNNSLEDLNVYPNPTESIITIKTNFVSSIYQIQSLNGSIVKTGSGEGEFSININDLPSGVYFLNLDNGIRNYQTKIVKI